MFDNPFDFLPFVDRALSPLSSLCKAMNQVTELRKRLDAMERAGGRWRGRCRRRCHGHGPSNQRLRRPRPKSCRKRRQSFPAWNPSHLPRRSLKRRGSRLRPGGRTSAAAAASRSRLRGDDRHPLGGVDRRTDAGARRFLHGALFDRGRPARPRRAHDPGRAVRAGAACRRRMDPPQGKHLQYRGAADRQYPGDSHRRRYGGGVCNGLRGLCALRIPGARHRLHPARAGGAGHARRGAAARTGARRSRRRRRLRDPDPGFLRQTGLLGALCLSRDRHRGRLRPGAGAAVALACGHHDRVRAVVDVPVPAMRTLDGRSACVPRHRRLHPRRPARGVRLHVRPAGRARPDRADLILARSPPIWSAPC